MTKDLKALPLLGMVGNVPTWSVASSLLRMRSRECASAGGGPFMCGRRSDRTPPTPEC